MRLTKTTMHQRICIASSSGLPQAVCCTLAVWHGCVVEDAEQQLVSHRSYFRARCIDNLGSRSALQDMTDTSCNRIMHFNLQAASK